jgi:hypothetical protein
MLPGAADERPLLVSLGPSSSGKTAFLELIGAILYGFLDEPRTMPTDLREFETQCLNAVWIVYDNVGKIEPEIRDRFCTVSTGGRIVRRILYTDKGELNQPIRCTVALSAINDPLREVEHHNRRVSYKFAERPEDTTSERPQDKFVPVTELVKPLLAQRNEIILSLLRRCQLVIEALEASRNTVIKSNVRLAGVARVLVAVARQEGWEPEARKLLDAWEAEQMGSALENDDLSRIIATWITDKMWEPGEVYLAERLNEQLLGTVDLMKGDANSLSWHGRADVLGRKLNAGLQVYKLQFGLKVDKSNRYFRNSRNNHVYIFNPTKEQLEAATLLAKGVLTADQAMAAAVGKFNFEELKTDD